MRGRPNVLHYGARARPAAAPVPLGAAALALIGTLLASGCGGGARQDAHEAARSYQLEVVHTSFPAKQAVARETTLELRVRNSGSRAVPNIAVALDSLNYAENFPQLAANKRPVWAIEQGPGAVAKPPVESQEVSTPAGAQTAYVSTWALGPLAAGATKTFRWRLMPVKPGSHTVNFSVFAGLGGKARAQLASGAPVKGRFTVAIAPAPAITHVDPNTGRIVLGPYSTVP